jgi:inorganic pyrophosphatase
MAKDQSTLGLQEEKREGPVGCLGMTFESDEARREHFLSILREKLQDPEFRKIEGFPIGEDEDILALSDPPYYTACPNPFLEDFIKCYGKPYDPETDDYHREPFAADVSEGKNDPIYNAHSYHTKVPHKAIMRYILHYTEPGDVVFDGFCGTGMTGVAAQFCGDKKTVESLGYTVKRDGTVLDEDGQPFSKLGVRRAVLNDLSPAATFIAHNYNTPVDVEEFEREAKRLLDEVEEECGWMYLTLHEPPEDVLAHAVEALKQEPAVWHNEPEFTPYWGVINYVVWSDVFVCPECGDEVVFWDAAMDRTIGRVRDDFPCQSCNAILTKRLMDRAIVSVYDDALRQTVQQAKQVPVLVNYSHGNRRYEKSPDDFDLGLVERIGRAAIPRVFPTERMPEGDEARRNDDIGITHAHHYYTKRNLWCLSSFYDHIRSSSVPYDRRRMLLYAFTGMCQISSRQSSFRYDSRNPSNTAGGILKGTLYVPSLPREGSVTENFRRRASAIASSLRSGYLRSGGAGVVVLRTVSAGGCAGAMPNTLDYAFTDPPFGANIMYSELNFMWEAWLRVVTNTKDEAIENRTQGKDLIKYQELMTDCFGQYYRALKPGRWMTVEFHNSQNRVWNAIQEALQRAGFVVADVRTLDKHQGSFKQVNSASAVKQDLVISAYKPNGGLEERFRLEAGTEDGVWDFVRTHLRQLPVFVSKEGQVEIVAERQDYLLFDRMVAFHVQRGVTIPLSAAEFYAGLRQRYPERDGMFFLPEQVTEYDRKRLSVREVMQLQLFVTDESSAIQWVRQQLLRKPQTFQDLQPQFMQEVKAWLKHEKTLELAELLAENFLCYDGDGEVPSQIHAYLSSAYHDLRNLAKDDPALVAQAVSRWYVPDPNKEADLEKIRLRSLMKEFEEYRAAKGKLKVVRTEALRAGFKTLWGSSDYAGIVDLAKRLPEAILQEDPRLLMYYDNALMRLEG